LTAITRPGSERRPVEAYAPDIFLKDEIKARGWNWQQLADEAGLAMADLAAVAIGHRPITQLVAEGLARALGTSAQLWINLDVAYQVERHYRRLRGRGR